MGLLITTDIDCDGCHNWTAGATGTKIKAREARRVVAESGWVRVLRDGYWLDLCPECATAETLREQPPPIVGNPFEGARLVSITELFDKL